MVAVLNRRTWNQFASTYMLAEKLWKSGKSPKKSIRCYFQKISLSMYYSISKLYHSYPQTL